MYSEKKMHQQLDFLKQYIYQDFHSLHNLNFWQDTRSDHRNIPTDVNWQPIHVGDSWSGRDDYFWLQTPLSIPAIDDGDFFVLHLNLGHGDGGNNSGFEGLLFVNGQRRQAIDSNHCDVYFDATDFDRQHNLHILLWTGLEGGGPKKTQHFTLKEIRAGIMHTSIRKAYVLLKLALETESSLGTDDPLKYRYRDLLDHNFRRFFWHNASIDEIARNSEDVVTSIEHFISQYGNQKQGYTISAIGHTHIDVAWLWRYRHTKEKAARSFSTVLQLMKEYPEYLFFHSTPQVYDYIKQDYPDLFAQIKQEIANGRWEADGATWVEPDTNLPSGESLTRQFLYGIKFFQENFGVKQTVLWLPDVFGYSWALPQIMNGFGIHNFMTTKISWNDTNRMPHDTFTWQGIDGSQVLTHFITTIDAADDYNDPSNWMYTYNGEVTPHTVLGTYHVYADKQINDDLLLSYGWGDGGGGPTREMIENVHYLDQLPGMPHVQYARVDDYFASLNKRIAQSSEPLATWNGELYLEFHRGTYTSQAQVKKGNRELEFALRNLEIRYTTAWVQGVIDYPAATIQHLWETLLRNQFHDVLPGSGIREVYEDTAHDYREMWQTINTLNAQLNDAVLVSVADSFTIHNPNTWTVTDTVHIPEKGHGHFESTDGTHLPAQHSDDGYQVLVSAPAMRGTTIKFIENEQPEEQQQSLNHSADSLIENDHYRIRWNQDGQIIEIFDKQNDRNVMTPDGIGNELAVYEDRPLEYDNWNIDRDYAEKKQILKADSITIAASGPSALQQQVHFHYRYGDSELEQTLTIYAYSPRIDFSTVADWREHQVLLRTAFDVDVLTNEATYDIQYGNVKRSNSANTSWDEAKFETVGHKWADLSQRDFGVALLNDSKYGYQVRGQRLSLSLIKAGIYPDPDADIGHHEFTYSLLPHRGDFVTGQVEQQAMSLNNPLNLTTGTLPSPTLGPLFSFDGAENFEVDAIKQSEDGKKVILRLHDYSGATDKLAITTHFKFHQVQQLNLNEDVVGDIDRTDDTLSVIIHPYQVVTLGFIL